MTPSSLHFPPLSRYFFFFSLLGPRRHASETVLKQMDGFHEPMHHSTRCSPMSWGFPASGCDRPRLAVFSYSLFGIPHSSILSVFCSVSWWLHFRLYETPLLIYWLLTWVCLKKKKKVHLEALYDSWGPVIWHPPKQVKPLSKHSSFVSMVQ